MILKAASIAFAVSLLCLMIPIVHFLSGPLAPAIGGFVGTATISARKIHAPIIGFSLALFWTSPVLTLYVIRTFHPNFLGFLGDSILLLLLGLFLWASILGTLGATIASNKKEKL